ncbi:MAG: DNA polymerase III subunit beta [Alphaproteobacteria bacterium]|nr:MAG: DNA polymerase III subunit beta [Alphaproteobacteria bacterium]TAF38788.1 MAG: DNA polymerase III subunit beta [Alphaproteobacteria bacterium]TAF77181.1 MAG: DNA polymerase III subunit beta [Alphaproteobacteria bacterium]
MTKPHFIVARASLAAVLARMQSVVEKRGMIPILANVRIHVGDGVMECTATDMEMAVSDSAKVDVRNGGSMTLPAHTLYDIVRRLPDDSQVEIMQETSSRAKIKADNSVFSLATLPADEFPALAEGELPYNFTLTREELRALVEKTRFAMSTEETRYYLNGVYLHPIETEELRVLRAVSTDGHRLCRMDVALPAGAAGMGGAIIPRKTIAELSRLLDQDAPEVRVALGDNKARFVCGTAVLVSKLIDGTYPDYTRVIPQYNDKNIDIPAVALAKAVDRVSIVASDKTRATKFYVENNKLMLSVAASDNNTAEETLDVQFNHPEAITTGFNARYMLEVLGQIEGNVVRFILDDGTGPAILCDPEDLGPLFIIMPMRV